MKGHPYQETDHKQNVNNDDKAALQHLVHVVEHLTHREIWSFNSKQKKDMWQGVCSCN